MFLISGGFRQLNMPLAHKLHIPSENVFSVDLLFDSDGKERSKHIFLLFELWHHAELSFD